MSRRLLQYRDSYKRVGKEAIESQLLSRHRFAKSSGKSKMYDASCDRHIAGVPGKIQASMPIKPSKASRLANALKGRIA